jgi:hypothetical protein
MHYLVKALIFSDFVEGIDAYIQCGVKGLNFPLMAVIHYMGYCLVAVSLVPIEKGLFSLLSLIFDSVLSIY